MISVEGLCVEFSAKPLFTNASFVVNDRDRIALVGKNGAGKSTLLKILCGKQQPTSGVVSIPNDTTIGYLPQVMNLQDDTTVREEAQKAFSSTRELKDRIDRMNQQLAERTDYESADYLALVERFTQEHDRYMMLGAENNEAEMERTHRSGLRAYGLRPSHQRVLGWLAYAYRTRQDPVTETRRAVAGRAHQPLGYRVHTVAGAVPGAECQGCRTGQSRPCIHQSRLEPHVGDILWAHRRL